MSTISPSGSALVTVRYVVMSTLNRLGLYDMKNYKRFVQIALEQLGELFMFSMSQGIEVVYLHMSLAKTVSLPSDFVAVSKIGFPINGKLKIITAHDQLLLPRNFDDTGIAIGHTTNTEISDTDESSVFFGAHFRNGQYVGGIYGLPGGIDGCYYRVDKEERQIVFSGSTPRSEIVLEYISNGVKESGGAIVPREAVPALRTYLIWQMKENDPRAAANDKERKKRQYEEEVEALRSFANSFTADEYLRMVWSQSSQSPKR